jgi:hypothetical protein
MKGKVIIWSVLLLAAFLLGFIPQYLKARQFQMELDSSKRQLETYTLNSRLCGLLDQSAMLHIESVRKNYGLAGERAARLFAEAQRVANETAEPPVRQALEDLLRSRDAVTAGLAKADPAVGSETEALVMKMHDIHIR